LYCDKVRLPVRLRGWMRFPFFTKRNSGSRKLPAVAIEVVLHGIHEDQ